MLKNNKKGFTLIEVVVVLVILAVMAAIAIPSVDGWLKDADERKMIAEAKSAVNSAEAIVAKVYATDKNLALALTPTTVIKRAGLEGEIVRRSMEVGGGTDSDGKPKYNKLFHLTYTKDGNFVTYCVEPGDCSLPGHDGHYNFVAASEFPDIVSEGAITASDDDGEGDAGNMAPAQTLPPPQTLVPGEFDLFTPTFNNISQLKNDPTITQEDKDRLIKENAAEFLKLYNIKFREALDDLAEANNFPKIMFWSKGASAWSVSADIGSCTFFDDSKVAVNSTVLTLPIGVNLDPVLKTFDPPILTAGIKTTFPSVGKAADNKTNIYAVEANVLTFKSEYLTGGTDDRYDLYMYNKDTDVLTKIEK